MKTVPILIEWKETIGISKIPAKHIFTIRWQLINKWEMPAYQTKDGDDILLDTMHFSLWKFLFFLTDILFFLYGVVSFLLTLKEMPGHLPINDVKSQNMHSLISPTCINIYADGLESFLVNIYIMNICSKSWTVYTIQLRYRLLLSCDVETNPVLL